MGLFVCVADESADQNPRGNFVYAGFAAPIEEWEGAFAAAWTERVLKGTPQIPYLHQTSIRSPHWRATDGNGIGEHEAFRRLDQAALVIQSTGCLIPVSYTMKEAEFDQYASRKFRSAGRLRPETLRPDYFGFLGFALAQLHWIHSEYPDVRRVDFWVERNDAITRTMRIFHADLVS